VKHRARWIALIVAFVLVAFGVLLAVQKRDETSTPRLVQQHAPAPALNLTTLDGKKIDAKSLQGKTYVVNFFNSWCIPCRQEAGALQAFYDQHKGEADFEMIGIVRDDDESAVRSYVKDQGVNWPVAINGGQQASLDYGTTGQPETYVIAPNGRAACGALGPSSEAELNAFLQIVRNGQACKAS
jgi:cytochrome c biogenesis protein CcmG/thiol:disulfide interchange protein DsbE